MVFESDVGKQSAKQGVATLQFLLADISMVHTNADEAFGGSSKGGAHEP